MSKPKILIFSGVQGDTRRYRTHHLYEQLRLAGADCTLSHITHPNILKQADQADILILHRIGMDEVSQKIVGSVRRRGALLLLDVDDLVFDTNAFQWIDSPDFADPIRARLYLENIQRNRDLLDQCDAVIASTDFLAETVRKLGKPVWVHRNGFSLEMMAQSAAALRNKTANPDEIIIGYASGTRTHDQDFALVRPALEDLLRRNRSVQLYLAGRLDPGEGWQAFGGQIHRLPFVPWRALPEVLSKFDINLAPLRSDNPFCQSKSEIKYMEAAMVQVPTIASPTDAFLTAIRPGKNGALAANSAEWAQALDTWVEAPEERIRIAANAYHDACEYFSPWVRAVQLRQTLNEISAHLGQDFQIQSQPIQDTNRLEDLKPLWVSESVELHPTLFERGLYSMRSRGALTLSQELWIYVRRLLEPLFPFKRGT